jgi:glucose/arabinose dehydrogenase
MRLNATRAAAAVGFVGIALIVGVGSARAATLPTGFEERTVASGLSQPTSIAWAPDGRMFIAQQYGKVFVLTTTGSLVQLLDIGNHVNKDSDRGLEGIAVDSDFANNHYLWLLYVYEPTPSPGTIPRTSRLTRVTVANDNTASAETTVLGTIGTPPCPAPSNTVDCIPADYLSHMVGTVRSDPDGTLWIGDGDSSDYNNVDPQALRTYNEQSLSGKIIHIDRNGNGLPGHAFCPSDTDLTHVCTKLYGKGFRNPYRFALRPGTGPSIGDVGWNNWEELSLATGPGKNYGWPCYEGANHTTGYKDLTECQTEYAKEGTPQADTPPDYQYPHTTVQNYSAAIMGGPVYPGGAYPSDFNGNVFIGDYVLSFIKRLQINSSGQVTGATDFDTNGPVPVDLELGPGNDLYYVDFGDGNAGTGSVKRIVYTPTNRTPIAQATATPTFGPPGVNISFSSAGTYDPDNDPITYDWDFGDATAHSTQANPSHVYANAGEYDAKLTVTDSHGAQGTATAHVSVGNTPPVAAIQAPVNGSEYLVGQTMELRGKATDAEDGNLTGSSLQWQVNLLHNTHVHTITGLTGNLTSFPIRTDHDANSHYHITLTATDSAGRSDQKTVDIWPKAVNLTFTSSPPGAPITYGGTVTNAPYVQQSAIGFQSTISADPTFVSGGTTYDFAGWSDGGARAHTITIPSQDGILTASYVPEVWFEGEAMSPTPNDGVAIRNIADPNASGGNTISFRKSPSYATEQYTTPTATDQVTLRMYGDQCQGPPIAVVSIDGSATRSINVDQTSFTDFTLPLDSTNGGSAGTHTIKVEFDNNLVTTDCDRNIYLDKVSFRPVPPSPPAPTAYARSKGATPDLASLVPSFTACRTSNRTHGAPLSYPSCAPPVPSSANLTIGTPDANGATANMIGQVRLDVATSDVRVRASVSDVRCLDGEAACGAANTASGPDYTGQLQIATNLRITDADSGGIATTLDSPFNATVPCTATTADASIGSSCSVDTSVNAIVPGAVSAGGRAIWQLGKIEVYDGGTDGVAQTAGNTLFLTQGVFVP